MFVFWIFLILKEKKNIYTKMGGGVNISLQLPPPTPLNKNEENKKWLKLTKITEKTCFVFWIFLMLKEKGMGGKKLGYQHHCYFDYYDYYDYYHHH